MKVLLQTTLILFSYSVAFTQSTKINESKFISIGGIEQWITITGDDHNKPIILFLHGGPGSVMSPYAEAVNGHWKKDFILVNWDQRGAGRTFGRNAPAEVNEDYWIGHPLTIEQMTSDAIELSEYLIKTLGKKKLILIGTSWGSALGSKTVLKRPDLFYAYIGHSQIVNASEGLIQAYDKSYQLAQSASDQASIDKLISIGKPPYEDAKSAGQLLRIIKKYENANSMAAPALWWAPAPEYNNELDNKNRENGDDYSFINYMGHKKLGIKPMMLSIDFMKDGLNFKLPVYLIQGEHDILTPKEISRTYFNKLTAPKKEYFLLPDAAHGYNQSVVDMQYKIVSAILSVLK